MEPPLKMITFR